MKHLTPEITNTRHEKGTFRHFKAMAPAQRIGRTRTRDTNLAGERTCRYATIASHIRTGPVHHEVDFRDTMHQGTDRTTS